MDRSKLLIIGIISMLFPFSIANSHDVPTPPNPTPTATVKDDSDTIVYRLQESMDGYGLISVEQHTGRLLFNPNIDKLNSVQLKQKFLIPAMIVNQKQGLKIITEMPFSCFLISGAELASDQYKGFKQYETARYLRDVKVKQVSRVLLCQVVGLAGARGWGKGLALDTGRDQFVFDEHTSMSGQKFYYFLNADGLFEMYL